MIKCKIELPKSANEPFNGFYCRIKSQCSPNQAQKAFQLIVEVRILCSGHLSTVGGLALLAEDAPLVVEESAVQEAEFLESFVA